MDETRIYGGFHKNHRDEHPAWIPQLDRTRMKSSLHR